MKFNLKNLALPISIMISISGNCINSMELNEINTSSNVINTNNNVILTNINLINNINNQKCINIIDLNEENNFGKINNYISKCNSYDKKSNPLVKEKFSNLNNDFGKKLVIEIGNNFDNVIESFQNFSNYKLELTSKQIIFVRYLATIAYMLLSIKSGITSSRISNSVDNSVWSINGIENFIKLSISDTNNIILNKLFNAVEILTKTPVPNEIQKINNNNKFLISEQQYNNLLECIVNQTIVNFISSINEKYSNYQNSKSDNSLDFTKTLEEDYNNVINAFYENVLGNNLQTIKKQLNEACYCNYNLDNAKKFLQNFTNYFNNKQKYITINKKIYKGI